MKAPHFLFLLLLLPTISFCQTSKDSISTFRKNIVFADVSILSAYEVWIAYSFNYERIVLKKKSFMLSTRGGAGQWSAWASGGEQLFAGVSSMIGKTRHWLEIQAGYQLLIEDKGQKAFDESILRDYISLPYFQIGYTYLPPHGRFMGKVHIGTCGVANISLGYLF